MFWTSLVAAFESQASAKVGVITKSLKDATHIELSGPNEWRYDVRHDLSGGRNLFSMQFKGVLASDMAKLAALRDPRVKSVRVKEGVDGGALVEFELIGRLANLFDYQTEQPPSLIID